MIVSLLFLCFYNLSETQISEKEQNSGEDKSIKDESFKFKMSRTHIKIYENDKLTKYIDRMTAKNRL